MDLSPALFLGRGCLKEPEEQSGFSGGGRSAQEAETGGVEAGLVVTARRKAQAGGGLGLLFQIQSPGLRSFRKCLDRVWQGTINW
jgi:uncharacterized protein YidB (DUF937 family)